MPEVHVEPGRLPEYDVDVGRARIEERVEQIEVPKVGTETREIRVPVLDLEPPAGGEEEGEDER